MSKDYFKKEHLLERLNNELSIHSRVEHYHIVKLLTYFEEEKYIYIVMDLAPNGSLRDCIKDGKTLNE